MSITTISLIVYICSAIIIWWGIRTFYCESELNIWHVFVPIIPVVNTVWCCFFLLVFIAMVLEIVNAFLEEIDWAKVFNRGNKLARRFFLKNP